MNRIPQFVATAIELDRNIDDSTYDVIKTVNDNINHIVSVDANFDKIKIVSDNIDNVNELANNYNDIVLDANMILALLNVDLGSAHVDENGYLIMYRADLSSTPELNDDGYLVINYS